MTVSPTNKATATTARQAAPNHRAKQASFSASLTERSRGIKRRLSEIRQIGKYFNNAGGGEATLASGAATTTVDAATNTVSSKQLLKQKPKRNKAKENLRTTLMLTIVCVLFLIAEFPQSIILSLSIIKGKDFYDNVYMPLGDLLDMLVLINNSINFLLYCSMSRAFRNTFYNVMVNLWCCKAFKRVCLGENSKCLCCSRKPNVNSTNFSLFSGNTLGLNNNNITVDSKIKTNSHNVNFAIPNDLINNNNNNNNEIVLAKEGGLEGEQISLITSNKEAQGIPVTNHPDNEAGPTLINIDTIEEKKALLIVDCQENCVFTRAAAAGSSLGAPGIVDATGEIEIEDYEAMYDGDHDEEDDVDENQI